MMHYAKDLEANARNYGAIQAHRALGGIKRPEKKAAGLGLVFGCVVVPWIIFAVTYYVMAFFIRYWTEWLADIIAAVLALVCLGFGGMAFQASMGKGGDPLWLGLLCLLSIIGYLWAMASGSMSFQEYMQPYFDLQQLNVYQSVNPATSEGNQYMDFGVINFVETAAIDRAFSTAFKNDDMYCVAPIFINGTKPATFDYWAVGINCCSQHLYDFRCGEWNNPLAKSGVRVVSEAHRGFYQLAAQEAAAAFDIPVRHPVFFEWVSDPADTIEGMRNAALKTWILQSFYFFCVEVALVIVGAFAFSKA